MDWRVRMLAREGDIDGAYREIAEAPRQSPLLIALYYPEMRAFRADPRFIPLAGRYGLIDYWSHSGGHWPDFCAERDRPYEGDLANATTPIAAQGSTEQALDLALLVAHRLAERRGRRLILAPRHGSRP